MTRHRHDGLRKICGCPRRQWAKCAHPWHFNFKWHRTHYRFSLDRELGRPIPSKTEARTEADRLRAAIRDGTFRPIVPALQSLTLGQLTEVYFDRYMTTHRPASLQNEQYSRDTILRTVLPPPDGGALAFSDWPVVAITADTLERFKEVRLAAGKSRGTSINRNLTLLRAMFNWAILKGYLQATPFKRGTVTVVHLFDEFARERRLEPGEEDRLLAACKPHLRGVVEAALETACRLGELLSLQWRQVRWEQNEIHLLAGKTKAKKPRYMPISHRLRAILEMRRHDPAGQELPPEAYVFGNEIGQRVRSVKTAWRLACNRAGITGLHFHDLRREAASRLLEGDVPEHYVQAVLGHADLSTTSKYLATTRKGLHQVMQRYEVKRQATNQEEEKGRSDGVGSRLMPHASGVIPRVNRLG